MNLITIHGQTYARRAAAREPVFVADQPRQRSAADQPHLGVALLVEYLEPLMPRAAQMASVRLPDGRLTTVAAAHLCPITAVADRRILPRPRRIGVMAR